MKKRIVAVTLLVALSLIACGKQAPYTPEKAPDLSKNDYAMVLEDASLEILKVVSATLSDVNTALDAEPFDYDAMAKFSSERATQTNNQLAAMQGAVAPADAKFAKLKAANENFITQTQEFVSALNSLNTAASEKDEDKANAALGDVLAKTDLIEAASSEIDDGVKEARKE